MASNSSSDSAAGPAPTRLRQIALVAKDLKKAEHLLTTVLGTEVIFVDPGVEKWGLRNILVAIGGEVIEVVAPFKPNTTAGRLLAKRGEGGYMIIMQTGDAVARRKFIEARGLSKVIFSHGNDESVCIQYHPKGIKGGMMPELDSHTPTIYNPEPLAAEFSPWHACGPDYVAYSAGMRRCAHLQLRSAVCRLAPGDSDIEGAARQWEEIFGVPRAGDALAFTNARLGFEPGRHGLPEGLVSITIGVKSEDNVRDILSRAQKLGLSHDNRGAWVDMLGLRWYFIAGGNNKGMGAGGSSKL